MAVTASAILGTLRAAVDRAVLVELYNATDGRNWRRNTNWNSTVPLDQWSGVCTDDNGRVTKLLLSENLLSGEIPESLGRLGSLTVLNLLGNRLSGKIPQSLDNLTNLTELSLGENRLSSFSGSWQESACRE